jgi:hypothetical protein
MSLIHLIAIGNQNMMYNITRDLVIDYFTEVFVNGSFDMIRHCDVKIPEYLEIELSSNISIDNFTPLDI